MSRILNDLKRYLYAQHMDDFLYAIAVFILHYTCRGACMYDGCYPAKGSLTLWSDIVRLCHYGIGWSSPTFKLNDVTCDCSITNCCGIDEYYLCDIVYKVTQLLYLQELPRVSLWTVD